MLKKSKKIWGLLGCALALKIVACTEEEPTIGLQFIDETSFELASIDTITMKMSTFLQDSVQTSLNGRLLVGTFTDSDLGMIKSSAFFTIDATIAEIDADPLTLEYQNTAIRLYYDDYYINDTTQIQDLYAYELDEELENDDGQFYNTTDFKIRYEDGVDAPIGQTSYQPMPSTEEYVDLAMSDRLGQQIFNLTFNRETDESVRFTDLALGFKIEPDEQGTAIVGFAPKAEFVVNYIDYSTIPAEEKSLVFPVSDATNDYFTQLHLDEDNDLVQLLRKSEESVPTSATSGKAYLMGAVGLGIRLELPYVRNILQDNPNIAIDQVVLSLRPVLEKYEGPLSMPATLQTVIVDKNNDQISDLVSTSIMILDDEFDRDTQYILNMKDYLQLQLSIEEINQNALLVTLPSSQSNSLDYLVIGDTENAAYKSNILLNLIRIKND